LNGVNIAGATNATLMLDNFGLSQSGRYTVVISQPGSSISSSAATIAFGYDDFLAQAEDEQIVKDWFHNE